MCVLCVLCVPVCPVCVTQVSSSRTFRRLWKQVSQNLDSYRTFPRLAGGQNHLDLGLHACQELPLTSDL